MDNRMKTYKEIAYYTTTKEFYEKAKEWGESAAKIFGNRTQLSNLRSIADTTFKVTDILNYIKNQAAKSGSGGDWNKNNFGQGLISLLYENEKEIIVRSINAISEKEYFNKDVQEIEKQMERQQIHLKLCRIFIKQMVVHYNFMRKAGPGK